MKKIIITGNVGRDAESRADQSGNTFTSFTVAVSVGTKANPKTDWVDVTCNAKLGEIASLYVKKGTKVLIEGFPTVNAYMTKEGKPAASLRIYANTMELLSRKEDEQQDYNNQSGTTHGASYAPNNTPSDSMYETLPPLNLNNDGAPTLKSDDIPF